jgi:hypothetical protein
MSSKARLDEIVVNFKPDEFPLSITTGCAFGGVVVRIDFISYQKFDHFMNVELRALEAQQKIT